MREAGSEERATFALGSEERALASRGCRR
jgi:hypothetical protein